MLGLGYANSFSLCGSAPLRKHLPLHRAARQARRGVFSGGLPPTGNFGYSVGPGAGAQACVKMILRTDMSQNSYREITTSAVVFGLIAGAVMNAAIAYAGLKIGFTIPGSAIAAVLGFGILRGILRRGSILETNIGQTVASAVNIPNSGVIFTVPALVLMADGLHYADGSAFRFSAGAAEFWMITLACMAGAVMGCAFIIPLRKQMIDIDRLRFPNGTAVAAILKSPGAGGRKSLVLVAGALVGALIFLPAGLPTIKNPAPLDELDKLVAAEKITLSQKERTMRIAPWVESQSLPQELIDQGRSLAEQIEAGEIERADADALALMAYQISAGEKQWSDLIEMFWAKKPLPGYSDLGWRLSTPRPAETGAAADLRRFDEQWEAVDRDQPEVYGHQLPDLVLTDESIDVGRWLGFPDYVLFVFAIAPFSLGAGYITGRAGLVVLAGGVLAYWVLNPAGYLMELMPATMQGHEVPDHARVAFNRPLGIGMLIGGAIMGVLATLPAMRAAIKSIAGAAGSRTAEADELSLKPLIVAVVLCAVGLFVASTLARYGGQAAADPPKAATPGADGSEAADDPSHADTPAPAGDDAPAGPSWTSLILQNAAITVVGLFWIWFAGIIIAQCTGMTDWSPISGISLLTIALMLALTGATQVIGAVLIGAALCVSVTCAADMMQDLKTGHLVGASPRRQQIVELAATGIGPLITMFVIWLIVEKNMAVYGVPMGEGTDTAAPQAAAAKAVIQGVGGGDIPYVLYGCGALLGVVLGIGSFAGLGVLVGISMYLPLEFVLTYGVGCLLNMLVARLKGRAWAEEWGVPFCAGLIVGESLLALVINALVLLR